MIAHLRVLFSLGPSPRLELALVPLSRERQPVEGLLIIKVRVKEEELIGIILEVDLSKPTLPRAFGCTLTYPVV